MSDKVEVKGGMGFLGWLTILFVGLKLTGYITWNWFWVLSPVLIPVSLVLILLLFAAVAHIRKW